MVCAFFFDSTYHHQTYYIRYAFILLSFFPHQNESLRVGTFDIWTSAWHISVLSICGMNKWSFHFLRLILSPLLKIGKI